MQADLAARLRRVMKGETIPKSGVTGAAGVAAAARYASNPLKLQQLRPLRVKTDGLENAAKECVTGAVASQPESVAIEFDEVKGMGAKPPAHFSDLYATEADYARRLVVYARQDGLSLTAKAGRLIIGLGNRQDPDLLSELRKHESAVIEAMAAEA